MTVKSCGERTAADIRQSPEEGEGGRGGEEEEKERGMEGGKRNLNLLPMGPWKFTLDSR